MFGNRTRVATWTAGGRGDDVAGWHCSWCVDVDGIRTKLVSAQNGDFPRWGDYPAKLNTTYIRGLVAHGVWFDDKSRLKRYSVISGPPSLLRNRQRYDKLVRNVYADAALNGAGPYTSAVRTSTPATANRSSVSIDVAKIPVRDAAALGPEA